jgi:hypothetical protein
MKAAKRARTRLLRIGLVLFAAAALFELGVRAVLLGGWFADRRELDFLREPGAYASHREDLHWQLLLHLDRKGVYRLDPFNYDELLGWLPVEVEAGTYEHAARRELAGRRPVLLFGDSYAACAGSPGRCFEQLMAESELAERFVLVNYGCGGYGVDQIHLLLERSLPLWVDEDPIVLVGVLLDDDLDRARMELRGWTKPRLALRDGALVPERDVVPSTRDYMRTHFPPTRLWSWDLFARSALVPVRLGTALRGQRGADEACRVLSEHILNATVDELERHDVPAAFLLFNSFMSIRDPAQLAWRETTVTALLERRGAHYVLPRKRFRKRVEGGQNKVEELYKMTPPAPNHFTALGNEVAFRDVIAPLIERLHTGN